MNVIKCCLNWKVIGGLVLLGGVLLVMAPGIGASALPVLFLLACPLSMLVMMPLMMKGSNTDTPPTGQNPPEPFQIPDQGRLSREAQINRLKTQMALLQSQQEGLVGQINQLEIPRSAVLGEAERIVRATNTGERTGPLN